MLDWLWTWGGRCFGYRRGKALWTHDGRHAGNFENDEIYDKDGKYLGEVINGLLITNKAKKGKRTVGFAPFVNRVGYVKYVDYAGNDMLAGYEDFPKLEK